MGGGSLGSPSSTSSPSSAPAPRRRASRPAADVDLFDRNGMKLINRFALSILTQRSTASPAADSTSLRPATHVGPNRPTKLLGTRARPPPSAKRSQIGENQFSRNRPSFFSTPVWGAASPRLCPGLTFFAPRRNATSLEKETGTPGFRTSALRGFSVGGGVREKKNGHSGLVY